jgi:signal transduction histidine kinase
MKIREKLFFSVGIYIFLGAFLGFFAYMELRTITTKLALVEVADDINNAILEIRRHEKNYFLYKDENNLRELKKYLDVLKNYVVNIKVEITREIGTDKYDSMKNSITEYEYLVNKIVENLKSQEGLAREIRNTGRIIEKSLHGEELQNFLVLRKYEKNLITYKDQLAYKTFAETSTSPNLSSHREMKGYLDSVKKLFELFKDENDSVDKIRLTAREISSLTENLSKKEREDIDAVLDKSTKLLLLALFTMLGLGAIINIKLSTSISTPIQRLEKITKKIATGDFSETMEVKGRDEITSLEISFNQMEERLKNALNSLEQTIKELREKQAQLVEAEKLASIGKFASGIAHEINNPLTSILTFSSLMLEKMPDNNPNHERLRMMVREAERARTIVRQLLSFAREEPINPVKINIKSPVAEITDSLIAQGVFKDIELILNISDKLPEIYADPGRIGQVVSNILLNAVHAITPPGKIEISTKVSGNFIELIFSDTGCGIPEENISKIFDPFFTTKDRTKGTGLGLAVSYGIIKKHGGDIEVQSTVGKGTTFIVRLPING